MWWMNRLDSGNWIAAEFEKRGVYLNDVAAAGEMDKPTLFRIVKGTRTAGVDSILAIARGLGLPPVEVFCRAVGQPLEATGIDEIRLLDNYRLLSKDKKQVLMSYSGFSQKGLSRSLFSGFQIIKSIL